MYLGVFRCYANHLPDHHEVNHLPDHHKVNHKVLQLVVDDLLRSWLSRWKNHISVGMLSTDFNRLMDQTSRSIHQFVGVTRRIKEQGPTKFMELTKQLLPQIGDHIANNYALNIYFTELVSLFIHICL